MPSYAELLRTDEWKAKRDQILIRDEYQCQNCLNENIIKDCEVGTAINDGSNFIKIYSSSGGWLSTFLISNKIKLLVHRKSKIYYYSYKNKDDFWMVKIAAYKNLDDKYIYVQSLHVHHKYYQEGLNPWDYHNTALTTYCWLCHEQLHSNMQVPKLDRNGNEIGKFTRCNRCHGAGEFPEFRHVELGICFRCNGACYEELISNRVSK